MNHVFRLIWNARAGAWSAVAEISRRHRGGIVGAVSLALCCEALALPQGAHLGAGAGSIASAGATMTVNQSSQRMTINWQSFGIGSGETVSFVQPNASAIALNRVIGTDPSQIAGRLSANGQVWLINPNGIVFGQTAQVNVGALVAATLGISDVDFMAGKTAFGGSGFGSVDNAGEIDVADRGHVALLGGRVANNGRISARLGSVMLAAGKEMTLDFAGDQLLNVEVTRGVANALAANAGSILADSGRVLLTTRSMDAVLQGAVNNTGLIQARSIDAGSGSIRLLGGAQDTVTVGGTLDASSASDAPGGGILTAGGKLAIAPDAIVRTDSAAGADGTWTLIANGFHIAAANGDASGEVLGRALDKGNVTLQSTGAPGDPGNIRVDADIAWSRNSRLALSANGDLNIAALINQKGNDGNIALRADNGGACLYNRQDCFNVSFTPSGGIVAGINTGIDIYYNTAGSHHADASSPDYSASSGAERNNFNSVIVFNQPAIPGFESPLPPPPRLWMLVNDIRQLQAIATHPGASYALGRDIDASATATWNGGAGFRSIGMLDAGGAADTASNSNFTGRLDGLGHVISYLFIGESASLQGQSGLFAATGSTAEIRNLRLSDVDIDTRFAAALVGSNSGLIDGVSVSGHIAAAPSSSLYAGGLVMINRGSILNSAAEVSVTGGSGGLGAGGLVGLNAGLVRNSSVRAGHAGDLVSGSGDVGGLAGKNTFRIEDSRADIDVKGVGGSAEMANVGGLVGSNFNGIISGSHATGDVFIDPGSGSGSIGALAGENASGNILDSDATGRVASVAPRNGQQLFIGGLLGRMFEAKDAFGESLGIPTVVNSVWNPRPLPPPETPPTPAEPPVTPTTPGQPVTPDTPPATNVPIPPATPTERPRDPDYERVLVLVKKPPPPWPTGLPKHPPPDGLVSIIPPQAQAIGPLLLALAEPPVPESRTLPAMPSDDIECMQENPPAKPVAKPRHARRTPKKAGTSPALAEHPACGKPASLAADTNGGVPAASCPAGQAGRLSARTAARAARVHRAIAQAGSVGVALRCFVRPR